MELNVFEYRNWLTLILLLPVFTVALLCLTDFKRTILLFNVFINKKYFYRHKPSTEIFKSSFYLLKTLLLIELLTFTFWFCFYEPKQIFLDPLQTYFKVFLGVFCYYLIKIGLVLFSRSLIKEENSIKQIKVVEESYSIVVFSALYFVVAYMLLHLGGVDVSINVLVYLGGVLFFFRVFTIVLNNKNLISGHLLYFILYLCILEFFPFIYILSAVPSN